MHKRIAVLVAASVLACAGTVAAATVNDEDPGVSLSTGADPSARADTTAGGDDTDSEDATVGTTATSAAVPTTIASHPSTPTTKPLTTTTLGHVPTTSTTFSSPTTTAVVAQRATIRLVNHYPAAVRITISDVNENEWTLEPDQTAGPWTLITSTEHGDGATIRRVDTDTCGAGDGEDYFTAGHEYLLEAVAGSGSCGAHRQPVLVIHDLTTGTDDYI